METAEKLAPLGFGFMRLPLDQIADDPTSIDIDKCCELVDIFMDGGFTYFDSARGYHGCKSEWALQEGAGGALSARVVHHRHEAAGLACRRTPRRRGPCSTTRLQECGVDYFDYYLLHNLGETLTPRLRGVRPVGVLRREEGRGQDQEVRLLHPRQRRGA